MLQDIRSLTPTNPHPRESHLRPSQRYQLLFFRWDISVILLLRHFGHRDILVICLTVVLKLAVAVLISLYFQTFRPKWLNFFRSFQKHFGQSPNQVPTPQSVRWCWQLQLPECQLGLQPTSDGESVDSWEAANNLALLPDLKGIASFFFHRWNVGTNPDLPFASVDKDNRLPDRCVCG